MGEGLISCRTPGNDTRNTHNEVVSLHIFIEILHQDVGFSMFLSAMVEARCYRRTVAYPLTAAQTHLGDLVAEARQSHRPVTISEDGKPVAAVINIDDLADLQDRAALAAHLADKAAGRNGIGLDELDAALDRIDAETLS